MSRWPDLYSKPIDQKPLKEMTVSRPMDLEDRQEDADARIQRLIRIRATEKAYEDHSLSY